MLYNAPPLILAETSITDARGTISLENLPDPKPSCSVRLENSTPLMERLWRIALANAESNIVTADGVNYFGAGTQFGLDVFTRDISFSGVLGLNQFYPDVMLSSMKYCRDLRTKIGFSLSQQYSLDAIDAPWETSEFETEGALAKHWGTASIARRTDDVVWVWCTADLIERHGLTNEWQWFYDTGEHFFSTFYQPFFDETDGLYRGQSAFIDIHFPHNTATGYPADWSILDCILCKTPATNCLYVLGLRAMARAAEALGKNGDAMQWTTRADALSKAVRNELMHPDGYLAYYKDKNGVLADRREALGSALAVISGVVSGADCELAVGGYPVTDGGVPLFHPFFDSDRWYHNHSSWPFVDTFFIKALELSDGVSRADLNAALLARTCVDDGSFHEVTDYRSREAKGSKAQLWSAAAFLDTCMRAGLV